MKPDAAVETADIESLDHEGRGVTHVAGKAVFVDRALPGESVSFRRTRRQRRHDEAEVVEVIRASPDRVTPRCPHFGTCGGCALQHLAHGAQLEAKGRIVAEALERIGNVVPERWLPPLSGPAWSYRRRARLDKVREGTYRKVEQAGLRFDPSPAGMFVWADAGRRMKVS